MLAARLSCWHNRAGENMQIALAHNNTDFDSLACQFAVTKLYPDARIVLGRSVAGNLREYLSLYRDSLPLVEMPYVDPMSVTHAFVVDCQQAERLDDAARKLITQGGVPYTVFDHHEPDPHGLLARAGPDSIVRPAGACTTLLVEKLLAQNISLSQFEATLLAIGIYEDSGCLTYGGTTAIDARCVAYLLEQGADLRQVSSFINSKLDPEQAQLLQTLVNSALTVTVCGARLVVATTVSAKYVDGLSTITRRLLEVVTGEAAVALVRMRDRVHIVGRSDTAQINMREALKAFGGGGHPGAASAVVKHGNPNELAQAVISRLQQESEPELTARQIMRSPVRTIRLETTMEEAARLMLRYEEDGLVVIANDEIVGVVSKRDIDKALHHRLGHAPVKGFMSHPVITVEPQTGLSVIQQLMIKKDIGRLPVVDAAGKLSGIVGRREVLCTLFGGTVPNGTHSNVPVEKRIVHVQEKLRALEPMTDWLLRELGAVATGQGMLAYAVGGCVRDLFLGRQNFDLDFVIEGNAIQLAYALESAYPGRFEVAATHDRFQTATLFYYGSVRREVDLSTARTEFYERPAALPTVEASVLEQDLYRRDFTINALAVNLSPGEYGDVVDFFDGTGDLQQKLIRVLHQFSFIEDPTRIIRAVRFAARLHFQIEDNTRAQAARAIAMGTFDNLGGFRLKEELKIMLEAPERLQALDLLNELGGGLRYLAADLVFNRSVRISMRRAERLLRRHPLTDAWIVYLGTLLASLSAAGLETVMERLSLATDERLWIRSGVALVNELGNDGDEVSRRSSWIYEILHGHADQTLAIAASLAVPGSLVRRWIKLYLDELKTVRIFISGNDLMKLGFPQGPQIKEALLKVHQAKLDGELKTEAQELEFVYRHYPQYHG
jgi:tRNA nucleotidyltransferase (CCA-adding enzyme)